MSLRTRLTIGVAALVSIVVVLTGGFMFRTAKSELRGEVDSFLEVRAELVSSAVSTRNVDRKNFLAFNFPDFLSRPDAVTQLLDGSGKIKFSWPVELPINEVDLEWATRESSRMQLRQRLYDSDVEGIHYRVLSREVPPAGLIQIGRDLSEVDAVLGEMKNRIILFGAGGILFASLVAWVFVSRFTRPVVRLTKAAEKVAKTQDLVAFIEVGEGDSEVNRLAESFNIMLEALATSREQQQRLIEDASHELRTPLTSLRTNIEVLLRSSSIDPAEQSAILADVKVEAEQLGVLVTELVELATSVSRQEESFTESDLGEVADEVVDQFRRRTERDLTLTVAGENIREIRIFGIQRAISNLIENAIKFSPEEMPIDISVKDGRVAVRDHGTGIPEADKARMFDRFFRSTTTRSMPGSGLGLSIVSEVIRIHGGEVFVEDPPNGQGTIVGFEI
ncbi:MAG: ATP-binding protein [Actinomycetota bacterium]|nr:ATP-binding protein [Actinomycetota bacterium]